MDVLTESFSKDIVLKESNEELSTVEITYEMPVKIVGDTIVYNSDSFTSGKEKKLEDVLKKLPGIDIDDNGEVEVEGKKVQKILVEGKEFFDGDSKLATQNIVGYDLFQNTINKNLSGMKLSWKQIALSNPNGYKSSVEFIDNDRLITCGTSGVDFSNNKGGTWEKISDASFHIVKKHPTKRGAYLAGAGGRISFVEL